MSAAVRVDPNHMYFPDINKKIYYDNVLLNNLELIRRSVRHDRDMICMVSGDSGAGKSVFAMQLCKALDNTFNMDRVIFDGETLVKKLIDPSTPKYSAWIYDEGREGLSARNSMTRMNKIITDCFAEIRQKNLFVFILIPDFFDADQGVSNRRSRYLFHVYETPNPQASENEDPFQRGRFLFFSTPSKRKLFILGKRFHDMDCVKADFYGSFLNQYVVDEKKYRELKISALRTNRRLGDERTLADGAVWVDDVIRRGRELGLSLAECGLLVDMSKQAVHRRTTRLQLPSEVNRQPSQDELVTVVQEKFDDKIEGVDEE